MANSTINFYKVAFPSDTNALVDDLEQYLSSLQSPTISNFQYIRHDLDITIKVDMPQDMVNKLDYNYVSITNDDESTYYYFIDKREQLAQNTVMFRLNMDTINSLNECKPNKFSETTLVTRQHEDRFCRVTNPTSKDHIVRKISKTLEDFTPAINVKNKAKVLDEALPSNTNVGKNWYLIIASDTSTATNVASVQATIATDNGYRLNNKYNYIKIIPGGVQLRDSNLRWNVISESVPGTYRWIANEGDIAYVNSNEFTFKITLGDKFYDYDGTEWVISGVYARVAFGMTYGTIVCKDRSQDTAYFDLVEVVPTDYDAHKFVRSRTNTLNSIDLMSMNGRYYYSNNEADAKALLRAQYFTYDLQSVAHFVEPITKFLNNYKQIYKIYALPYCPVDYTDESGNFYFDESWSFYDDLASTPAYFRGRPIATLNSNGTTSKPYLFINRQLKLSLNLDYLYKSVADAAYTKNYDLELESKMYNSQFFTSKINYDSFNLQIKPESFDTTAVSNNELKVEYKVSSTLSNTFGFKANLSDIASYDTDQDYQEYMIVTRNNEYPTYTSEYLEYIRNGYNYDVKANKLAVKQATENAILSTGAATIAGAAKGGAAGAIAGLVGGTVTSAMKIGNMIEQQDIIMKKNLANLAAQGQSISGSDDLAMLQWYNGNALRYYEYGLNDELKKMIANHFRLYGYAANKYMVPNTTSRAWYNYIQCEPEIEYIGIKDLHKEWIDDVKSKYQDGVTVFHHHNIGGQYDKWDFDRKYENYETWIFE